jgi:hypothetical protein
MPSMMPMISTTPLCARRSRASAAQSSSPWYILAELDYLLREFLGVEAELDFLEGIARGAYTLESFTAEDLARVRELIAT